MSQNVAQVMSQNFVQVLLQNKIKNVGLTFLNNQIQIFCYDKDNLEAVTKLFGNDKRVIIRS